MEKLKLSKNLIINIIIGVVGATISFIIAFGIFHGKSMYLGSECERLIQDNRQLEQSNEYIRVELDELKRLNNECNDRILEIRSYGISIERELEGLQGTSNLVTRYLTEIAKRIAELTEDSGTGL